MAGKAKNSLGTTQKNLCIDYDQLAHSIAKALDEADKIREKREQKGKDSAEKQRKVLLRQKEIPQSANQVKRLLRTVRNKFVAFWCLLTLKKADAAKFNAATSLAQVALSLIFQMCEWALYIAAVLSVYTAFAGVGKLFFLPKMLLAIAAVLLARVFRLAMFEVDQMTDKQYMIALLSAVASFFAMVFALANLLMK